VGWYDVTLHPLIVRLMDGEITLEDLPPELRGEGARVLHLMGALDRTPVTLSPSLDATVMAAVRRRAASPAHRAWRWLVDPRELRLRVRPWLLAPALAAAAALLLFLPARPVPAPVAATPGTDTALVRFVFYSPTARAVTLAGSFNDWSLEAAPLTRGERGVWTVTLPLAHGHHEYAFVVDGRTWTSDPAAPAIDDGLGHRNSVVAVGTGARVL
jgi:hypothetical protein